YLKRGREMEDLASPSARWARRRHARPAEILDAALAVFAQKGYAAARMDDIAARAGVTKGTIYLYFENKEAVFKTLVRESLGAALDGVLTAAKGFTASARDFLVFVITTMGPFLSRSDRVVLVKVIL